MIPLKHGKAMLHSSYRIKNGESMPPTSCSLLRLSIIINRIDQVVFLLSFVVATSYMCSFDFVVIV